MSYEVITLSTACFLASILIFDFIFQPQRIMTTFHRKRLFSSIKNNLSSKINTWIVVTGSRETGKTTIFNHNQWVRIKSDHQHGMYYTVWKHPDKPVGAIEVTINLATDNLKIWKDAFAPLKPKKIFVCINPSSVQQLDHNAKMLGPIQLIMTHCEKVSGFSMFMKQLADSPWCFKLPNKKEIIDIDELHEGFDKLHAQFQSYGNYLLNDIDDREQKRIINDFPQHFHQMKFNLAKLIKVLHIRDVYCCGLLWQSGRKNLIFSPKLESGLELKNQYPKVSSGILFCIILSCIAFQLTWYQTHMNQLWEKQSLTHLVDATNKLDHIKNKSLLIGEVVSFVSPKVKLSPHQQDEIKHLSRELKIKLNQINPLIASLKLRFDRFNDIHPALLPYVIDSLSTFRQQLDISWNAATLKEQFLASLHYSYGHVTLSESLPNDIKVDEACQLLSNRISETECTKLSKEWIVHPTLKLDSFQAIVDQIDQSIFSPDLEEKMHHLQAWLKKLSSQKNADYLAFEFIHNHAKNPNTNHILNDLGQVQSGNDVTEQILNASWHLLMQSTINHMNFVWENTIFKYYQKNIHNLYPINPNSFTEIDTDKFNRFYSPKGLLDLYYSYYIQPFLSADQTALKPLHQNNGLAISKNILHYFKHIKQLQSQICSEKNICQMDIFLQSKYTNENWQLEIAGKKHDLSKPLNFIWPSQFDSTGVNILDKSKSSTQRGIWGIWRWFESGQIQDNTIAFDNHLFTVEVNHSNVPTILKALREIPAPSSIKPH